LISICAVHVGSSIIVKNKPPHCGAESRSTSKHKVPGWETIGPSGNAASLKTSSLKGKKKNSPLAKGTQQCGDPECTGQHQKPLVTGFGKWGGRVTIGKTGQEKKGKTGAPTASPTNKMSGSRRCAGGGAGRRGEKLAGGVERGGRERVSGGVRGASNSRLDREIASGKANERSHRSKNEKECRTPEKK